MLADWKHVFGRQEVCERVRCNESLSEYTSFRIGGKAANMLFPESEEELARIMAVCKENEIQPYILGGGSNLLITKDLLPAVICLRKMKDIEIEGSIIKASAGASLSRLVRMSVENGLEGFEPLSGIPGTVGGALAGNAGGKSNGKPVEIGDYVEEVRVLDQEGKIYGLSKSQIKFGYRSSSLRNYIIVSAVFQLKPAAVSELKERCRIALQKKQQSQPLAAKSAGCIFKNPPQAPAWQLITEAGLAGKKIGSAMISNKHANFVVNLGDAKANDVLELIQLIQGEVKSHSGIDLNLEVKIW